MQNLGPAASDRNAGDDLEALVDWASTHNGQRNHIAGLWCARIDKQRWLIGRPNRIQPVARQLRQNEAVNNFRLFVAGHSDDKIGGRLISYLRFSIQDHRPSNQEG